MPLLSTRNPQRRRRLDPLCPALRFFGCFCLRDAKLPALDVLAAADHCPRCHRVLDERFARRGSTLFYDDDPRTLAQMFDAECRDACTLRLLAACIVVHGRERVIAS